MPDPNAPQTEPSADETEGAPNLSDAKIDPELSAQSAAILEGKDVELDDDEVDVVEPHEQHTRDVEQDFSYVILAFDVTCKKCGHKNNTSMNRKAFEAANTASKKSQPHSVSGTQPRFQTKCKFCNYVSTYILETDGPKTVA